MKTITDESYEIINNFLWEDTNEDIIKIEDAVKLNKEFWNKFSIEWYFHPYKKYKENNLVNNWDIYCLWETLYESILLWWFNYFKDRLLEKFWIILNLWYYDYSYKSDNGAFKNTIDKIDEKLLIELKNDSICNYFLNKFL